jgi:hypothetical protein
MLVVRRTEFARRKGDGPALFRAQGKIAGAVIQPYLSAEPERTAARFRLLAPLRLQPA